MMNRTKDHFIRYRNNKDKRMTLIVGFRCHSGIALVSDTKITNTETGEPSYAKKILTPLKDTPFIVGAAGYTNLFQEFNRKIPEIVAQRLKQYQISNIQELMKIGYTREDAMSRLQSYEKNLDTSQAVQETQEREKPSVLSVNDSIVPPFAYSGEDFLDDCRTKIKEITSQVNHPNPLELLIGHKRKDNFPSLFYMSPSGRVEEIRAYTAIGSGQPYVKMYFDRLYDYNKSMNDLITDACRSILFAQIVAKESSVGFSDELPPEAVVIFNEDTNGKPDYGKLAHTNIKQVLDDIQNEMKDFEKIISTPKKSVLL